MGCDTEMIVAPGNVLITEATSLEIVIITADVYLHVISISIRSRLSPYHNYLILVV